MTIKKHSQMRNPETSRHPSGALEVERAKPEDYGGSWEAGVVRLLAYWFQFRTFKGLPSFGIMRQAFSVLRLRGLAC